MFDDYHRLRSFTNFTCRLLPVQYRYQILNYVTSQHGGHFRDRGRSYFVRFSSVIHPSLFDYLQYRLCRITMSCSYLSDFDAVGTTVVGQQLVW